VEAAETPFWQQLLLNSIGPLVTVVIGSLIVGTFAANITRSAQDRRAEGQLRRDMVTEGAEIIAKMWYAYSRYLRALGELKDESELAERRKAFDESWPEMQVRVEVFHHRLKAYYASPDVATRFRDAERTLRLLREIAMERFLQSDISRAYWTDMEPDLVRASDGGDAPDRNEIEKDFRDRTETFMDMLLADPLQPMA
jgi:hypothetical protein